MTANVRIIVEEKAGVLRVPSPALRFQPPGQTAQGASVTPPVEAARVTGERASADGLDESIGRVWVRRPDGQLVPIAVRLGIADGDFTEIVDGGLEDGQEVVVGLVDSRLTRGAQRF
jgi:HlyD family secretion protein